jgi:O-antigen ligase
MRTRSECIALALLVGHIVLLCCGGRDYVKIRAFGPLYVTEVVLLGVFVLSWRSVVAVPWDRITNLVALFVAFGIFWAVVGGVGDTRGPGAKAFSFFVYSAFYFVVRGLARDDATRWRVLHGIALATIGAALIGIVQTQTGAPLFDPSARFEVTTTGSTRWLGGEYAVYAVIGMCVPAMAAIVSRRLGRTSALLIISASIELVLAQHRSGFIAAGVALFATTAFIGGSAQTVRGLFKLIAFVALGIGLYLLLFGGSYLGDTASRIGETTDFEDGNIAWRLQSWHEVLDGIVDQPLGHGFSTWNFMFAIKDPLTGSHNDFLDLAYRIGVPGLVAFMALPVSLILQTRRLARDTGPATQLLPLIVCAAMLALLVFASFNVVFESPQVSILFWVLIGLGGGTLHDRVNETA